MTVYVYSPVHVATGGTELLQQYCSVARSMGFDAVMLYPTQSYPGSIVERAFASYENPYVYQINDSPENAVIVPETAIRKTKGIRNCKTAIWWLSVDNYPGSLSCTYGSIKQACRHASHAAYYAIRKKSDDKIFKQTIHFYQSQYAKNYVIKDLGVISGRLFSLSDYINERYLLPEELATSSSLKKDVVLYNPAKGIEFTKKLIRLRPDITWTPLKNIPSSHMPIVLQSAKVYIDFGHHPGKDRIPREAAISGCCVITSNRGAARNQIDVPIPEKYKFAETNSLEEVSATITSCLNDYESNIREFAKYREWIRGEKNRFETEVLNSMAALNERKKS